MSQTNTRRGTEDKTEKQSSARGTKGLISFPVCVLVNKLDRVSAEAPIWRRRPLEFLCAQIDSPDVDQSDSQEIRRSIGGGGVREAARRPFLPSLISQRMEGF